MGFAEAVRVGLNNFFNPTGRASRSEFWWYYLFAIIIAGVLGVIGGFLEGAHGIEQTWIGIIVQIFSAIIGVSVLCAEIRRMHDIGKSGWNICWGFIPLVGWIIVLIMLCKPTQYGYNPYGDPVDDNFNNPYDKRG